MMTQVNPTRPTGRDDAGAENRIDRRLKLIKALLFATGIPCGAYFGWYLSSNDFDLSAPMSPVAALLMAATYLLANLFGWLALAKVMDEVEKTHLYKASGQAASLYLIVYPVWFLLWKGGFVIEPIHWLLFVAFWLSMAGAALYYRFS